MAIKEKLLLIICLFSASQLSAYTKFKFIEHTIKNDLRSMAIQPPFSLERAGYSFTQNSITHEVIKNYVYLTAQDRKKIQKILAGYDRNLAVSPELIQRFKSSGRLNNNVVGLVLQDFKIHKADATIGNVLDTIANRVQKLSSTEHVKL